jgi:hypothetical protein
MVPAGGGDFERALGAFLSLDVAQVERSDLALGDFRLGPRENLRALEVIGDLDQRRRRDDLNFGAGPGRFRAADRGTDQPFIARIRTDGGRQHARDRRDRTVEAEFAQHCKAAQRIGRDRADGCHQSERNGKIVMTAFLRQIGRREIDGDSPRGQRETRKRSGRSGPVRGLRKPPCPAGRRC